MDWGFIASAIPLYLRSALLVLWIGAAGVALSITIGLLCEFVDYFKTPFLRKITRIYIAISRNTPLLIQLFFIYYGLPKVGLHMSAAAAGISGLAFLAGGYMAETFRSGVEAVGVIQFESALSLGLTRFQTARYVIFPQALRVCMRGLVANIIFIMKETSVFSAISLMDLMFVAKDLIGLYYNTTECLTLLVLFYLLILLPVSFAGRILERRLKYA